MNVAVLGASNNPDRYSHKAVVQLLANGHKVFPVNPAGGVIEGQPVCRSLADVGEPVDTITVYIGPANIKTLIPAILACRPKRVIANPGAESILLKAAVMAANIEYLEACTLVMLRTGQF